MRDYMTHSSDEAAKEEKRAAENELNLEKEKLAQQQAKIRAENIARERAAFTFAGASANVQPSTPSSTLG